MKQVRFNVFETNSSSTHSLVFKVNRSDYTDNIHPNDTFLFEVFHLLSLCDAFELNKVYARDVVLEMFNEGQFPTIDKCNEISLPCNNSDDTDDETIEYYDEYCHANDWWNRIPDFEVIKVAHNNIIVRTTNNSYLLSYYLTDGESSNVSEIRIVNKDDIQKMIIELTKTLK